MDTTILKSIRTILIIISIGVYACAFFLYDNYRDKLKFREAAAAAVTNESEESVQAATPAEAPVETAPATADSLPSGWH
jgi:hypothetical protein